MTYSLTSPVFPDNWSQCGETDHLPVVLPVLAEISVVESREAKLCPTEVVRLVDDAAMLQEEVEEEPQDDQRT